LVVPNATLIADVLERDFGVGSCDATSRSRWLCCCRTDPQTIASCRGKMAYDAQRRPSWPTGTSQSLHKISVLPSQPDLSLRAQSLGERDRLVRLLLGHRPRAHVVAEVALFPKNVRRTEYVGLDPYSTRQGLQRVVMTAFPAANPVPGCGEGRRGGLQDGVLGNAELPLRTEPWCSAVAQIPFHNGEEPYNLVSIRGMASEDPAVQPIG